MLKAKRTSIVIILALLLFIASTLALLTTQADASGGVSLVTVPTVAELANLSIVDSDNVLVAETDRGGMFTYSAASLTADGGVVFSASDGGYWTRVDGYNQPLNVKWFGAVGDGTADDTTAVQKAIDAAGSRGGGSVYIPRGRYKVTTGDINHACLWIPYDNIELYGDGEASEIFVTQNSDVPVHVSKQMDLSTVAREETPVVSGFSMHDLCVRGTGTYNYYSLAKGRGILLRRVLNAVVRNNFVYDMSMIGICSENGSGQFLVSGNIVGNCKYTAINYNGQCYQSIISDNICYGSDAGVNSTAIQTSGNCIISGNTVFGSLTNYANCGGIMWGEGPYHGIGLIENNLVKNCRFGIKTVYHGPCNIQGNTIINCQTTSGIILVGGNNLPAYPVESTDSLVSGNILVNNYPAQIETSAKRTQIIGNKLTYIANPINDPQWLSPPPDYLQDRRPEYGIRTNADDCSIAFNEINGAIRGVAVREGKNLGVIEGNDVRNTTAGLFVWEAENAPGTFVASHAVPTRRAAGNGFYTSETFGSVKTTQGFWNIGDTWNRRPMIVGQSMGETCINTEDTVTTASASAGSNIIEVSSAYGIVASSGNIIGIRLDNNVYHWSTVTAVNGTSLTLGTAIPAGRSVSIGAKVNYQQWYKMGNL